MNLHSSPYEAYRPSKNEWVDQTPCDWEEKRVKDVFRLVTDKAADDNDHELLSLYASIGVRPRKDLEARGNKASSTDGYWIVKKGDIVVNKLLAWMGSVGLSEYNGVTSPAYDVLRKTSKLVDARYFSYLFRTEIAKQIFKRNSRGIMDMRLRLYFDKLGAITVPVPPISTQQAIATYIDTKTAQIDRQVHLLDKKAKHYRLLKQTLIDKTTIGGLTNCNLVKVTNADWIDEIPECWQVVRLKDLGSLRSSNIDKKDDYELSSQVVNYNDVIKNQVIDSNTELQTTSCSKSQYKKFRILRGDLVITKDSMDTRNIANTSVIENIKEHTVCGYHLYIFSIQKNKANSKYYFYCFNNSLFKKHLLILSTGTTIIGLSASSLSNSLVPFPSLEEQNNIAKFLDEQVGLIDRIIKMVDAQVEKLKDLRTALINDVVTGKIKVVSEGPVV